MGLPATVVYRLLYRVSANPDGTFVRVAIVVLALSFIPDLAVSLFDDEATAPAVGTLAVLHIPPALVCVASLTGQLTGPIE